MSLRSFGMTVDQCNSISVVSKAVLPLHCCTDFASLLY